MLRTGKNKTKNPGTQVPGLIFAEIGRFLAKSDLMSDNGTKDKTLVAGPEILYEVFGFRFNFVHELLIIFVDSQIKRKARTVESEVERDFRAGGFWVDDDARHVKSHASLLGEPIVVFLFYSLNIGFK